MILTGTNGDETLRGSVGADEISGLGGHDVLDGRAGADTLIGGAGNDTLIGGTGNDLLFGSLGEDYFSEADTLGDDTLIGGSGRDVFNDLHGANLLDGGDGDDEFAVDAAGAGITMASGGAGRDIYRVAPAVADREWLVADFESGPGGDLLDVDALLSESAFLGYSGGNPFAGELGYLRVSQPGDDTLLQWDRDGAAGGAYDWVTVLALREPSGNALTADNVVGAIAPDGSADAGLVTTGTSGAETLAGGVFNDWFSALGGHDVLDGRAGADTLSGGAGNDTLAGGVGDDSLEGGVGDDLFTDADTLGDDTLAGGAGRDVFHDLYGDNVIAGDDGDDEFEVDSADFGTTIASGGPGRDVYRVATAAADRDWRVTDFEAGDGGDFLDVDALLEESASNGYPGGNPFATGSEFLRLIQSGADTLLQWDRDGAAGGDADWTTVLVLQDTNGSELIADNIVGAISPDGSVQPGQVANGTTGAETLAGGVFDDRLSGLGGADALEGRAGADTLSGGAGNDTLIGGSGDDSLSGGLGDDYFSELATQGNDTLLGGSGRDRIQDFHGDNLLDGGEGDDDIAVDAADSGTSIASGGNGRDLYRVATASAHRDWRVTDFEGGAGGDLLDVDALLDESGFHGYTGGNPFAADLAFLRLTRSGSDTLLQWDRGGVADDADDWITTLVFQDFDPDELTSDNFEGSLIVGTSDADSLLGGLGNDTVQGLAGDDTLDGSFGKDVLEGGSGSDLYFVDDVDDLVVETSNTPDALVLSGALVLGGSAAGAAGEGITDTVRAAINYSIANLPFIENIQLTGAASRATGNALGNDIRGNAGSDTLIGAAGDDTLEGGAGADLLLGGPDDDRLIWGAGDRVEGGSGSDTLVLEASLNLTRVANSSIKSIEQIDLSVGGRQKLTIDASDVLDLSDSTDTIRVLGGAADVVDIVGSFTPGAVSGQFRNYTVGTAILQVDTDIVVS